MTTATLHDQPFPWRGFLWTALIAGIWINVSEVVRYFAFVMPMLRDAFPQIADVAPMDIGVFAIWGLWDTILVLTVTGAIWICLDRFGPGIRNSILAATFVWAAIFVILWLGVWNMGLTTPSIIAIALPLAWLELAIAGLIVNWGRTWFAQ